MAKKVVLTEAYYSTITGNRVKKPRPTGTLTVSLPVEWLRGSKFVIDTDGMPANIESAKAAVLAYGTHNAKLAARRAAYKANKLKAVAKKSVVKKSKAVAKKKTVTAVKVIDVSDA